MAAHSSTLARKISGMEQSSRLQSMRSQRVGYDWASSLSLFTFMHWRRKWQPTPVFLPGESQGRGSLVGCRLWSRTELDTTEATYQQQMTSMYRVFSCVFGRGCFLWPLHSLDKTVNLWPALFCTPRPHLRVTPAISWFPTFTFQSPIMKRTSFLGVSSRRSCKSSWNRSTSASLALLVGA